MKISKTDEAIARITAEAAFGRSVLDLMRESGLLKVRRRRPRVMATKRKAAPRRERTRTRKPAPIWDRETPTAPIPQDVA